MCMRRARGSEEDQLAQSITGRFPAGARFDELDFFRHGRIRGTDAGPLARVGECVLAIFALIVVGSIVGK